MQKWIVRSLHWIVLWIVVAIAVADICWHQIQRVFFTSQTTQEKTR